MSQVKKLFDWYKSNKSQARSYDSKYVISIFVNFSNYLRNNEEVSKAKSGNLWTKKGILFVDEIPISVNINNNIVFIHPTYLKHLPSISPIKKNCIDLSNELQRRNKSCLPVDADTVNIIAEQVLR